jgi:RNA polymerase sigma-70 factor (ECF subfamily)
VSAAEDLAAEAFATAFRLRERFDPARVTARAWAMGIATNLLRAHYRSQRRRANVLARGRVPVEHGFVDDLVEQLDASHRFRSVLACVAKLPANQRNALYLLALGLGFAEAAAVLEVPIGTVQFLPPPCVPWWQCRRPW